MKKRLRAMKNFSETLFQWLNALPTRDLEREIAIAERNISLIQRNTR